MMIQMSDRGDRPDAIIPAGRPETCEEFQARIPELMSNEAGGIYEHAHVKTCARCSALLEELEYIGEIAKDLLEGFEPPDTLWSKISKSLAESDETNPGTNGHGPLPGANHPASAGSS